MSEPQYDPAPWTFYAFLMVLALLIVLCLYALVVEVVA